jgi:23S rRNA (pseudouridine1915-N3)-methyltransferase
MLKIKIFTVGKCKESWLEEALHEYQTRLTPHAQIEWLLAKDDKALCSFSEKESSYICLDPKGVLFTSEALSQKVHQRLESDGSRLSIFIGGAVGLPASIRKNAKELWSLSPLTFTHQITRLILLEQLYRSFEIAKGSKYHK